MRGTRLRSTLSAAVLLAMLASVAPLLLAEDENESDKDLAADLALLQGSWVLSHGNEGKGPPTVRSIKTIRGNVETLSRYQNETGELLHEHSVEFKLAKSGSVHVLTFFPVGGSPENGLSYVYKVDKDNFYDIPGLLHGEQFRNYQTDTRIWHWKRVPDAKPSATESEAPSKP